MNTLEKIEKEWEIDSKIDSQSLTQEMVKIPNLHSKYHNIHNENFRVMIKLRKKLSILKVLKYKFYDGTLTKEELDQNGWTPFQKKLLKNQIQEFVINDEQVMYLQNIYDALEHMQKFLESILSSLNRRGYLLRSILDNERFKSGLS